MKKRLLAMLLVLMLVVSLLPTGALADETPEYYRIRDPQALRTAAIEKAGYDSDDLALGIVPTISTRLFTSDGRYSDANSTLLAGQYYENTSVDATDRGVIMPDEIDRIRVTVSFSDGDYHHHTESVIFDRSEFNWEYDMDSVAGGHDIVWLTLNNTTLSTDGHKVEFYFQPIGKADWELYDIVYVNDGESIGSGMPADPNYGSQDFVSWQTNKDGSGDTLTDITVINKDWVVYGTKTSAGGATAYHVMRDSTGGRLNALQDEVADIYNAENNTAYHSGNVEITAIQVNGNGGEHTNPDYFRNGWRESNRYYYIYNVNDYGLDDHQNTRIPVSEVTGITLTGIIDGNSFSVTIPKDELALQEISNPGTSDTIIEISVCDKLDGITKELVESAEDAPADVTGVSYPVDGKVTIPEDGSVTLLYKITVTGDQNAEYIVTDKGATAVSGSLTGTLGADGVAVIYVTKTFSADDVVDGVLTNSASLSHDNTTLPPDDGNDEDEVKVEVEDEGGEEPGTDPEPDVPGDPDKDDLGKLAVVLECTNDEVEHAEKAKIFHMNPDNNTRKIENVGGQYICTVTPNYDLILERYNKQVAGGHTYADEVGSEKTFTLFWTGEAWDNGDASPITRQVKCDTPEQPNVYEIYVTVHNGTATFCGSEVTSHILAAENEDITITFTPDEGYTLDYATIDGNMLLIPDGGVYTLKQVDSDHTIEVFYESDKIGGGDDGNEPDGTPDYRQVFVKYVAADGNGSVAPSFNTFDLEVDESGKVITVPLSLEGEATPNADATFAYWTIDGPGYDGGAYSYEADLSGKGFTGYVAGETYTFKAHFNGPVVKPEAYDINVEVVNGTAEFKGTNIGANSVINVYPIEDDNKNVTITFVPEDGFVFDASYVGNEPVDLKDNSYTFGEVTADVTIKVLFKQDSVPITPVTPMPTPGEISDLIKDSITVDCVNGEVAHADKVYGLLDGSLVNVEKTDDTSIKVTLDATVYQARYNTDTETKHSLADGQSAAVTFALNYVDQTWRVAGGELPITIKVVCETPVEPEPTPDPAITGFSKTLVTDRNLYVYQGLAYPTFYRGSVIVDEGDGVTLLYKITVKGTAGTEFTVRDDSADFAQTGEIPDSGETSFYVAKTFTWREIRRADELTNTAAVLLDGEVADSDTETVDVDIDWDYNPPVVDDDEDEDDEVFVPNWLNTEDHYSYIVGYEDGEVKPNNNITRAEVATIFFRLLTDDARARYWSQTNDYTDVAADSWYNNAISTLSNMGIINGYEDGTFQPNASITRAEFTAIATRFFNYTAEYDGAFNDVSRSAWYADCVQAAVDMGLVDGYPDGGFHPNSNITRAEAVTIVNRVLNRAPHEDHLLDEDEMNVWPDNVYGAWYYADMQEATNSHDYDWIRVSGERVEEWTEKLPERDWAALEQEWSSAYSG